MPPSKDQDFGRVIEWASKILFLLVPIAGAWIVKLEVNNATQTLEIAEIRKDLEAEKMQGKEIMDLKIEIGILQVKQDAAAEKIDKLYEVLIAGKTK